MRELNIGSKRFTRVVVLDEPGQGNACHEYKVTTVDGDQNPPFGKISFQNGPIGEVGVNGLHQEDLLAIVIDRLQSFQKGDFRCRENAIALTKIEEAMLWLNKRTAERQKQGVEGTNVVHKEV
uniref:Putative structural protein n=1 Tax=viral metagenome TaxID=1070528 RepID=A0A6M3J7T5_9ZZZZ